MLSIMKDPIIIRPSKVKQEAAGSTVNRTKVTM